VRIGVALVLLAALVRAEGYDTLDAAALGLETALGQEDVAAAAAALAAIPGLYASGTEDAQKAAVAVIGKAVRSDDLRLRHGAFAALAAMKVKGTSRLLGRWLDPPNRFKDEIPPSYVEAIRAAGAIADANTVNGLVKLADHAELTLAEEATRALGGFHTLPVKRRKELAFDLIDRLERLAAKQRRKGSPEVYERKIRLAVATVQALQALTGQKLETVEGWRGWQEKAEKQKDPFS